MILSLKKILGIGVCLIFAASLGAQERERDYDWYHQQRDETYREQHWQMHLFAQVREDLDHVQSVTFPIGRDEFRIVRTKQELSELQDDLGAGRYDQAKLDDVIAALRRVVADNRLSARDRDVLNDDLNRMADYRAHHEGWGR